MEGLVPHGHPARRRTRRGLPGKPGKDCRKCSGWRQQRCRSLACSKDRDWVGSSASVPGSSTVPRCWPSRHSRGNRAAAGGRVTARERGRVTQLAGQRAERRARAHRRSRRDRARRVGHRPYLVDHWRNGPAHRPGRRRRALSQPPDPAQAASAAIENHLYYRYHVAASPEAGRVIRTMLPGQAGDAAAGE